MAACSTRSTQLDAKAIQFLFGGEYVRVSLGFHRWPERIVIQVDPRGPDDPDGCRRMQAALRNYRRRGYCLAMNVTCGVHRENILEHVSDLQPDYVRLDRTCLAIGDAALARAMTLIALLHESGAKIIVHRLETATEVRAATDYGVDVVAGSHFGRPSPDLRGAIPASPARQSSSWQPHSARYGAGSAGRCFITLCIVVIY
jgi:EAL domain-containing protein (putative c-di-GMP-specific phosphodiesterase class I)